MKVVYSNPILALTDEEMDILNRASDILDSICHKIDDYGNCKHKCPIYHCCPYHNNYTNDICGHLYDLLANITSAAEREEE